MKSDPDLLPEYDFSKSVRGRLAGKVLPGAKPVPISKKEALELIEDRKLGVMIKKRMKKSKRSHSLSEVKKRLGTR